MYEFRKHHDIIIAHSLMQDLPFDSAAANCQFKPSDLKSLNFYISRNEYPFMLLEYGRSTLRPYEYRDVDTMNSEGKSCDKTKRNA